MSNVHETGSRTMSKNLTQENIESNRAKNRPSAPSAQPKASPRAQVARAPRAQRLPAACPARALRLRPACRAPRAPAVACFARLHAHCAPCPCSQLPIAPARPRAHALPPTRSAGALRVQLRAQRLPSLRLTPNTQHRAAQCPARLARPATLVTIQILYRDTTFPANCLQYNFCIATHVQQPRQYNTHCNTLHLPVVYCNTPSQPAAYCNTLIFPAIQYSVLQYENPQTSHNTMQWLPLAIQFSLTSCNTIQD